MKRTGKTIALSTVAVGVEVLVATGIVSQKVPVKGEMAMKRLLLLGLLLNAILLAGRCWQALPVSAQDGKMLTAEQAEILSHFSIVKMEDGKGGTLKAIRLTGVNFQLVNGVGRTDGKPNGLGNLIVGYSEGSAERTGSHNVICGLGHSYTSYGGLVAGRENTISGPFSCVLGGHRNTSSGLLSSVSGGEKNEASGSWSSVSGGKANKATGSWSSVCGGEGNEAGIGSLSSVSGGQDNHAKGSWSSVSGGQNNEAYGSWSSVIGGNANKVSESWSWTGGR